MKGDFSRSTFDPGKHYRGVRMQQGRVQLDADWNEQADILLYLIATQLKDLLGPGATAATDPPGFAISLEETGGQPADEDPVDRPDEDQAGQPGEPTQPARTPPDFWIGAGRYYVDGILCENDAPVLFSRQPDYPAGSAELQKGADADYVLVYLDVWERHITAAEDPPMREIALGGPDTTTRVKTVWQVKLWPLSGDPTDDQGWRERGGLRSLQAWTEFEQKAAEKGRLRAKWEKDKGVLPENHLYRVEIHTVADDQVTFKWSRENGSVVFPIREEYLFTWEDVPGKDNKRLLSYLREGLALDWAEDANISKPDDGPTIRIEKDGDWAQIVLDEGEKTATLTTSDGERRVLKVRQENKKLNVYTYIRRIEEEYLFTWEDVPGKDNKRLLSYLREDLALDWAEGNQISISKDGPTIRIEKDGDWAQIVLDEGGKTATLTTSDGKRRVLKVRQEKDKRSIYSEMEEYLFAWEDVPGKDSEQLLSYLRKDLALGWAEDANISKPDDGPTIRIEKDGDWAQIVLDEGGKTATLTTSDGKRRVLKVRQKKDKRSIYSEMIELNLEGLERDPYQLSENDWVEIVDDVTVLNGCSLPLCQVKELDRQHGKIKLLVDRESIKPVLAEIGEREPQHPLLRRWDQKEPNDSSDEAADDSNWENGVIRVEKDTWQALEHSLEVCFTGQGPNQPGDYWLIPARTHLDEGIEWPRQDGQASAQPPHGTMHHYAPLALLRFGEGGWRVEPYAATAFHSLPHITANLIATDRQLEKVREIVDTMVKQTHVFENFKSEAPLEQGDVVCMDRAGVEDMGPTDPGTLLPVKLASSEDGQMVVGVVWEPIDHDSQLYRIAVYGRLRAKVIGEVKPGDLLVPSPVPGHAQRAGLYLQPGTILGKALSLTRFDRPVGSGLSQQTGSVDMLVTLG